MYKYLSSVAEALENGAVAKIGEASSGRINETFFTSLADAVNSAKDDSTIYLLKNISSLPTLTVSGKNITVKSNSKHSVTPNQSPSFALTNGASLTLEGIRFSGYDATNLITVGNGEYSSRKSYTVKLKSVSLDFSSTSGAIYAYNAKNLTVGIEKSSFSNSTKGNVLLNFGGTHGSNALVESCNMSVEGAESLFRCRSRDFVLA